MCVLASAIIARPRDYAIAGAFPAWMTFSPGIAPVLADAAVYALLVVVGYAVMRLVAGSAGYRMVPCPAAADPLARPRSSV